MEKENQFYVFHSLKKKRKKEKERYPSIEGEMPFRQIDYWLVMHQLLLNHKCKYYDKCKYMSSQA